MRAAAIRIGLALSMGGLWAAMPPSARACAPVSSAGARVAIAGEQALIVWDPAAKREHFVRTATFDTQGGSFGFLVPVPALPEIAEADEALFERLDQFIESRRPEQISRPLKLSSLLLLTSRSDRDDTARVAAGVQVLETTRVAGMDVAVLAADSASALAAWLREHGFDSRPSLTAWLDPYVAARYKICAFKYEPDATVNARTRPLAAPTPAISSSPPRPIPPRSRRRRSPPNARSRSPSSSSSSPW